MLVKLRDSHRLKHILWIVPLLVVVGWLGSLTYTSVHLLGGARSARDLASAPLEADPAKIDTLVGAARADIVRLNRHLGWLAPIGPRLSWLPGVGPLLAQAPAALDLADALSELGVMIWEDLSPTFARFQQGADVQSLLPEASIALARERDAKLQSAEAAASACQRLDPTALPARVSGLVDRACEAMPLLVGGLAAADAFPRLLGVDEPQSYLLLALNEDELRPGGGFITGVGEIKVDAGRVAAMTFKDSYAVDDFSLPYPEPPDMLWHFMALDLWVLRDSNWSPDFPTSAQQAIELYRPGYPVDVAGVIGIDQAGVQMLVEAVEPLMLPGASTPVTGDNLLDYIYAAWAPEDGEQDGDWWLQRKSFIADIAEAGLNRVQAGDVDFTKLVRMLLAAVEQRHLQIYLVDKTGATFLADQGWDGGLARHQGDFLMAVEANLGYNKVSSNIARTMSYELDLSQPQPYARATLDYQHLSREDGVPCVPEIRYDLEYQEMMHRCYWAYVRLLVPDGALLLDGTKVEIPADQMMTKRAWPGEIQITDVGGYQAFGQGFLMPTRGEQALSFVYQLPEEVVTRQADGHYHYSLYVQKQAGVASLDLNVTLRLPENAVLLSVHPETASLQDGVLFFDTLSDTDVEISVDYRLREEPAE
jgi:hypothetical protein